MQGNTDLQNSSKVVLKQSFVPNILFLPLVLLLYYLLVLLLQKLNPKLEEPLFDFFYHRFLYKHDGHLIDSEFQNLY